MPHAEKLPDWWLAECKIEQMQVMQNGDNPELIGALSDALVDCDERMAKVRASQPLGTLPQ